MKKPSFAKFLFIKLLPYIVAMSIIALVLPPAIRFAYLERGYRAIGGEALIPVSILVVALLVGDYLTERRRKKRERIRLRKSVPQAVGNIRPNNES